jgi:hypothetical protein
VVSGQCAADYCNSPQYTFSLASQLYMLKYTNTWLNKNPLKSRTEVACMVTETLTLPVSPEVKHAYEVSAPQEQRNIQAMVSNVIIN